MSTNFIATAQYKCHIMNGQTAMLNVAADFYSFGIERHDVIVCLIVVHEV
jgi:hypothetical protein